MPINSIRILRIDDNVSDNALFELMLADEPDLQSVGNLECADQLMEAIKRVKPDVIVIDLHMPGRDPLLAIREVHQKYPKMKVIVMSGTDNPILIAQAQEAGTCKFIVKGADGIPTLIASIREVMGRPEFPKASNS